MKTLPRGGLYPEHCPVPSDQSTSESASVYPTKHTECSQYEQLLDYELYNSWAVVS